MSLPQREPRKNQILSQEMKEDKKIKITVCMKLYPRVTEMISTPYTAS